jgi:hypothetical protein
MFVQLAEIKQCCGSLWLTCLCWKPHCCWVFWDATQLSMCTIIPGLYIHLIISNKTAVSLFSIISRYVLNGRNKVYMMPSTQICPLGCKHQLYYDFFEKQLSSNWQTMSWLPNFTRFLSSLLAHVLLHCSKWWQLCYHPTPFAYSFAWCFL